MESMGNASEPVKGGGFINGSLRMRLLKAALVTVFKRKIPILFIARSLLLEIPLGDHV
jgi:hypothetical protein